MPTRQHRYRHVASSGRDARRRSRPRGKRLGVGVRLVRALPAGRHDKSPGPRVGFFARVAGTIAATTLVAQRIDACTELPVEVEPLVSHDRAVPIRAGSRPRLRRFRALIWLPLHGCGVRPSPHSSSASSALAASSRSRSSCVAPPVPPDEFDSRPPDWSPRVWNEGVLRAALGGRALVVQPP